MFNIVWLPDPSCMGGARKAFSPHPYRKGLGTKLCSTPIYNLAIMFNIKRTIKYKVLYVVTAASNRRIIDKFGSIQLLKSPTKSPCFRQPPLVITSFSSCRHFWEQCVSLDYGVRSVVRHFMIMLSCGNLCPLLHDACGKKNDRNLTNPYQLLVHRGEKSRGRLSHESLASETIMKPLPGKFSRL